MRFLKTVYRHRYDEKNNTWSKKIIKNVLISGSCESYNLSDSVNRDGHIVLRIMGDDNADVLVQDVISFSESYKNAPPEKGSGYVVSVVKNSRGTKNVHHTRVTLK